MTGGLLSHAMTHPGDGYQEGDATVRTCWDADHLDFLRVGIPPNQELLRTEPAWCPEIIGWTRLRPQGN